MDDGASGALDAGKARTDTIARLKADPKLAALRRSLDVYYGDAARDAAMDMVYRRFIRSRTLAFDIGSHVGDRVASFRRLGAWVVAVEPQPDCASVIRAIHGQDAHVTLIESACGPREGSLTLQINSANPTVSTASRAFVRAAARARGWEGQSWDRRLEVPVTTLDTLIADYGVPAFVKIDVEGFELEVLQGLSERLSALSFEFTTIQRDVARRCLSRLYTLGDYRFNVTLGETHAFTLDAWCTAHEMDRHLASLPHEANSGDVYAVLESRDGAGMSRG